MILSVVNAGQVPCLVTPSIVFSYIFIYSLAKSYSLRKQPGNQFNDIAVDSDDLSSDENYELSDQAISSDESGDAGVYTFYLGLLL